MCLDQRSAHALVLRAVSRVKQGLWGMWVLMMELKHRSWGKERSKWAEGEERGRHLSRKRDVRKKDQQVIKLAVLTAILSGSTSS